MNSIRADILHSAHLAKAISTRKRRIQDRITGQRFSDETESASLAYYIVYFASAAGFIAMCAIAVMG
jgi:hypothetical protein